MPISNDAYKLLKHISKNNCNYDDISKFLNADYQYNKTYQLLDSEGYITLEDKFVLTEKGKLAMEQYEYLITTRLISLATLIVSVIGIFC